MRRVFVLGAGASAFAGYPLALDLWPFVRDSEGGDINADQRRQAVIRTMEPILKINPPEEYDRPDLEKLFTLLDLAHRGTAPLDLRHTDWPLTKLQIMGMISESFLWHQYKFQAEIV